MNDNQQSQSEASTQDNEPVPYTADEIDTFFHTANMLLVSIDQMEKRVNGDYNTEVLIARAAHSAMMDMILYNTTKEEFDALLLSDDDDDEETPDESHPGTKTLQ